MPAGSTEPARGHHWWWWYLWKNTFNKVGKLYRGNSSGERSEIMWKRQLCRRAGAVMQEGKQYCRQQRSPHSPWWRPRWGSCAPAAGGSHCGAGGCVKEAVTPWKARDGAGSGQHHWTQEERRLQWSRFAVVMLWGDTSWGRLFLKDCTLWEESMLEKFMKNCSSWERVTLKSPWKTSFCGRNPMLKQVKSVVSPPIEKKGENCRWSWAQEEERIMGKVF